MKTENIITVCYGIKKTWSSRNEAKNFFLENMAACDSGSSECGRYVSIYRQLCEGSNYCTDE